MSNISQPLSPRRTPPRSPSPERSPKRRRLASPPSLADEFSPGSTPLGERSARPSSPPVPILPNEPTHAPLSVAPTAVVPALVAQTETTPVPLPATSRPSALTDAPFPVDTTGWADHEVESFLNKSFCHIENKRNLCKTVREALQLAKTHKDPRLHRNLRGFHDAFSRARGKRMDVPLPDGPDLTDSEASDDASDLPARSVYTEAPPEHPQHPATPAPAIPPAMQEPVAPRSEPSDIGYDYMLLTKIQPCPSARPAPSAAWTPNLVPAAPASSFVAPRSEPSDVGYDYMLLTKVQPYPSARPAPSVAWTPSLVPAAPASSSVAPAPVSVPPRAPAPLPIERSEEEEELLEMANSVMEGLFSDAEYEDDDLQLQPFLNRVGVLDAIRRYDRDPTDADEQFIRDAWRAFRGAPGPGRPSSRSPAPAPHGNLAKPMSGTLVLEARAVLRDIYGADPLGDHAEAFLCHEGARHAVLAYAKERSEANLQSVVAAYERFIASRTQTTQTRKDI